MHCIHPYTGQLCVHRSSNQRRCSSGQACQGFRGEDTRKTFTDHLHAALITTGIIVFRDGDRLERGREIGEALLNAIKQSRFAVVVISQNYASSAWCLSELVKILHCSREMGQTVIPVFYGVDPSAVRRQKRSFEEAFGRHEKVNYSGEVQSWRRAMTQLANLSGFTSQDRHESELIKDIVKRIWDELSHTFPTISKRLVGIDFHMKKMNELFSEGLDDVRVIGVCGMGGIGKTTVARVYYDRVRWQFEGSCFIDVKEVFEKHGAIGLQEQLLSQILREQNIKIWDTQSGIYEIKKRLQHVKLLAILDNVDRLKQLEVLAGELDWFYPGSRIIITSRDRHILKILTDDRVYDLKVLNDDDALMLFKWKAFKQDQPTRDYDHLSRHVVQYANGLPLALEVLGSFLHGRSVIAWEDAIAKLYKIPNREIQVVLKVSYDGLEELERKIFLDIACFFKGENKNKVTRILHSCGFYADIGLDILIGKSMININSQNKIEMHDLLQAMGREVVRQESPNKPERRSRLWAKDDIFRLLGNNLEGEQIEGIFLELSEKEEPKLDMKAFSKLKNLRLLKINAMHLTQAPTYLSDELRFLDWRDYPSKSLPTFFHPDKLCELHMHYSYIQQLWDGVKLLKNLRIMDLSYSEYLIKTPNFTEIPNLEELILKGCTSLKSLHNSLAGLKYLRILDVNGCRKLSNVPENFGRLECLEKLDVDGTAIRQLPLSIFGLKHLKELSLRGLKGEPSNLTRKYFSNFASYFRLSPRSTSTNPVGLVMPSLRGLSSLTELNISYCNLGEETFPSDLGSLASLIYLDLSGNNFFSLPSCINQLPKLWWLELEDCKMLQSLIEIPSNCMVLQVNGCDSLQNLPDSLYRSMHLLSLRGCVKFFENNGGDSLAYTMLIRYIQVHPNPNMFFTIIFGTKTPKWFSHQTEEATLSLETPPCSSIIDDDEFLGLAVCIPFVPYACQRDTYWRIYVGIPWLGSDYIRAVGWADFMSRKRVTDFKEVVVYHLFTCFLSSRFLREPMLKGENQGFPVLSESGSIWVSYEVEGDIEIGRWGLRLVYRKDIPDLKEEACCPQKDENQSQFTG